MADSVTETTAMVQSQATDVAKKSTASAPDGASAPPAGVSAVAAFGGGQGKPGMSSAMRKFQMGGEKVKRQVQVTNAFASSKIFDKLQDANESKNPAVRFFKTVWQFSFHPHNSFHTIWDIFILLLVFYSSIAEPFKVAFHYAEGPGEEDHGMKWYEILIDLSFYADIIINFWTGVDIGYDIEFDKKAIAKSYLALWFWIDFVATVEWDLIVKSINPSISGGTISLVRLIKVARLARASRLINRLTGSWTINTGFVEATKFLVYVLICAHWLACFFFFWPSITDSFEGTWLTGYGLIVLKSCSNDATLATATALCNLCDGSADCKCLDPEYQDSYTCYQTNPEGVGTVDQYVKSMYWSLTTMTTIGYGDIGPSTQNEIIYVLFAMILGLAFFAVLLEQINKLYSVLGKQAAGAAEVKNDIVSFLKDNGVPQQTIQRVITFLNFKANTTSGCVFEPEDERFANLSDELKRKIHVAIFYHSLMKIKMFGHHDEVVQEEKKVRLLFDETDTDKGGSLDEEEIAALVKNLGMEMTADAVKAAVAEMEGDDEEGSDGMIAVDEFEDWWFRTKYGCPKIGRVPICEKTGACLFLEEVAYRGNSTLRSPLDTMFDKGEYPSALRILLSGGVDIVETSSGKEESSSRVVKSFEHSDRDPVFGFVVAISYEDRQRIVSPVDTWIIVARTYADVLSVEADDVQEMLDKFWPAGQADFLKLAKSRYKFDPSIQAQAQVRKMLPMDDRIDALESKVMKQLHELDELFDTTLSSIFTKLENVAAQREEFSGIG